MLRLPPPGKVSSLEGTASENSCAECDKGKYADVTTCKDCYPGKYSEDLPEGESACKNCDLGMKTSDGKECTVCPEGTYSDTIMALSSFGRL